MSLIVLPDAGALGMITNPKSSPENEACKKWLASLADDDVEVDDSGDRGLRSAPRVASGWQRQRAWTR